MEFTKVNSSTREAKDIYNNALIITDLASIDAIGISVDGEAFLLRTFEDFDDLIAELQTIRAEFTNVKTTW